MKNQVKKIVDSIVSLTASKKEPTKTAEASPIETTPEPIQFNLEIDPETLLKVEPKQ